LVNLNKSIMKKKRQTILKGALVALLIFTAKLSFGQIIFTSIPDSIAVINEPYSYQVTATAAPNSPTYSLTTAPSGMSITSGGLVSWTPTSMTAGGKVVIKAHNNWGDNYQTYYVYITDAVVCDAHIISYWPMDEKVGGHTMPEKISGYDGLWEGAPGPEPVISTDAMVGNSIKFDPTNNEDWGYNVNDVNQYEFSGTTQFSVAFWFKNQPSNVAGYPPGEIFIGRWCGAGANDAGWYIRWNPDNEHVEFFMRDNGPTDTTLINSKVIAADDYNWHHVVATFWAPITLDNPSYMNLYVDGLGESMQYDFWMDSFSGTEDLYLGYDYYAIDPYSGFLDEVTIWNEELLQSDVNTLRSKGLSHQPMCADGNTAPLITSDALTSATEDSPYSYTLEYREIDGDPVTKSAPVKPAWLSFNATTGVLSGNPTNSEVGDHSVTLRVSDGSVNVDQTFTLTVVNVNDAPTISSTPGGSPSVNEDAAYSYTLVGNDVDAGATLTYSAPTLPSWMNFNTGTHVLSGTPTNAQVGLNDYQDYSIVLRVTDNAAAYVEQSYTLRVIQVNDAPAINSQNAISTNEDVSITLTLSDLNVTDVDNTYPTDFILTVQNGTNYTHSGNVVTPDANWNGTLTVPISLSDGTANVSYNMSVTVNAVNDPPTYESDPVVLALVDSTYQYWITTDDVEDQTRTLACTRKPGWLSFSSSAGNGLLQGTPSLDNVGVDTVVLTVTDGIAVVEQKYALEVVTENWPPVFSSTPITSAMATQLYSYTVTATDQDANDLTFEATTIPSWLDFNAGTQVLSGIPADGDVGDHDVTISVSDGLASVEQSFTIAVAPYVSVEDPTADIAQVYPVPAHDLVMFKLAQPADNAVIKIYGMTGNLVKEEQSANQNLITLNVSDLSAGQYIYMITSNDKYQRGIIIVK
jgi:hypothetical protein